MSSNEEIEGLADILECVAVTLYEILGAAMYRALNPGDEPSTGTIENSARNIAYKIEAWDKLP